MVGGGLNTNIRCKYIVRSKSIPLGKGEVELYYEGVTVHFYVAYHRRWSVFRFKGGRIYG